MSFVKERLISEDSHIHAQKQPMDPLPNSKTPSFLSLNEINTNFKGKEATMKEDRNILQQHYSLPSPREGFDLQELMHAPIAIANTTETLQQSVLAKLM